MNDWAAGTNLYLLWADDNGLRAPMGNGEAAYSIDNVRFLPTTGAPIPQPSPNFGDAVPIALHTFTAPHSFEVETQYGGSVVTLLEGPEGAPNDVLRVTAGNVFLVTEQVDLRGARSPYTVSIDVRTFESNFPSDFETNDQIHVMAEYSLNGVDFQTVDVVPVLTGGTSVDDPNDALKALDRGEFGPYTHFATELPAGAQTVRLIVEANTNANSEIVYFDNLQVTAVPEPSSLALLLAALAVLVPGGVKATLRVTGHSTNARSA